MDKLEFRFYSLDEIAAATGKTERDDNFKRDTERLLARKGYSYEWHKGRGVTILSRDTSAQRRLKKLLVKHLGMHPDTDPLHFAYFIMALSWIEGFESAPWPEKPAMLYQLFGINPSESTLKRWAAKLYESGNATRFRKGALWKTITDNVGMKRRIPVDPESAEYKEFCDIRSAAIQGVLEENEQAKELLATVMEESGKQWPYPSSEMVKTLFDKYDIPIFIDENRDLNQNIVIQYIYYLYITRT